MADLIDRREAIDAIDKLMVSIPTVGGKDLMDDVNRIRAEDISVIKRLPSVQPDEEKISDALYNIYRNKGTSTSAEGVAAIKYYIAEIWREIYGEEGPRWMKK